MLKCGGYQSGEKKLSGTFLEIVGAQNLFTVKYFAIMLITQSEKLGRDHGLLLY